MTNRASRRQTRRHPDRRIWIASEPNDLQPAQWARVITTAGLNQARLEAEAQTEHRLNRDAKAARSDRNAMRPHDVQAQLEAEGDHD